MNRIVSSYQFLSLTVLSIVVLTAATFNVSNRIDEQGLRQGYWVITGNMTTDEGFTSESIVEEGSYNDDLKTGVWKKYYPSGELRSEISYAKNRPIGVYTLYYENGVVEENGNWQRTKNIGTFSRNYENGNPHQEFIFSDSGKRNGIQLYYHSNGELAMEVNLVNGQESGVMKKFDEQGELIEQKSFQKGKYQEGTTKGNSSKKEAYVPEPVKSEERRVNANTSKPEDAEATNAAHHFQPNGHNILYNKDKQVTQTGIFNQGRLWNGKWYKYNRDGILIRVDVYRQGKFVGHGLLEKE